MTPHKHKDLIIAWANGAKVQVSIKNDVWADVEFPAWSPHDVYRIKPHTIKYRNFLWRARSESPIRMCVVKWDGNVNEDRSKWEGFVRWVGDWQEVEI